MEVCGREGGEAQPVGVLGEQKLPSLPDSLSVSVM